MLTSRWFAAAGLLAAFMVPTGPVKAGSASDTILRNQTRIIGNAVQRQVRQAFYAQKRANIRAEPTTSATVIGQLAAGAPVTVTGGPTDGWYEIAFNDQVGYVWASLVGKR